MPHTESLRHIVVMAAVVGAVAVAAQAPRELLLTNARVYTLEAARPWAEAIAIRGDRIVAVGTAAEARAAVGSRARVVDLHGAFTRSRGSTMRTCTSRAPAHSCLG